MSRRGLILVCVAVTMLALSAGIASAVTGQLSFQGCFAETGDAGCAVPANAALDHAQAVAVSPDDKSVYVASAGDGSISHFTRDTSNGNLTYQGCFADTNAAGCAVPANAALAGASGVAVSPDDKSVYVASADDESISHFTRDTSNGPTNGNLTYQGCFADTNVDGCAVPANAALAGASGVAVSPDSKSVYVASGVDDSISHLTRDTSNGPTNGNLTYQGCFADTNAAGCTVPANAALDGAQGVAVSPDSKSIYVTSFFDNSVSHFTRDTSGGPTNGNLTYQSCFADTNAAGCAVPANAALNTTRGVAVSPESTAVYVASELDNSISHFTRDSSGGPTNGNLTYQGCFADTNVDGCAVPANAALDDAHGVAVSLDSKSVYVASDEDSSISHFTRGSVSGDLTFQGCFGDTNAAGCSLPADPALNSAVAVAVSPDSKSVYVASDDDDSISHFTREPEPMLPSPPAPPAAGASATGQRAAALKKCKKKPKKARKKCRKKAKKLPLSRAGQR